MDVGCPKCQTEYELDDSRVTEDGVTVKCATCGHVFRVKKKSLVVTLPATPGDSVPAATLPPPPPSREWKIRTPRGSFPCRDLTMLQKWIIEGKVHREDEISLTGETWKRLGDIPELGSFFQIYDDASKGRALAEAASQRQAAPTIPAGPTQQPPPPPPPSVPPQSAKITDTWKGGNFSTPPPEQLVPTDLMPAKKRETDRDLSFGEKPITETLAGARFGAVPRSSPSALTPAELQNIKRGGSGKWVALIFIGLAVGGGVGYYFGIYEPQQREQARLDEELRARAMTPPTPPVVPVVVEVDAGAAEVIDAGAPELDAGVAVEDAGVVVDAGAAVDAGAPELDAGVADAGVQEPKSFEYYLRTADRLRNREKAEAALDYYDKALDLKPDRAEPYAGKGLCLLDMANTSAAIASFDEALKLNRRYGPAIMGMAEAQRTSGNNAKAVEYYERYLEVLPDGPEAAVARNGIERLKK